MAARSHSLFPTNDFKLHHGQVLGAVGEISVALIGMTDLAWYATEAEECDGWAVCGCKEDCILSEEGDGWDGRTICRISRTVAVLR